MTSWYLVAFMSALVGSALPKPSPNFVFPDERREKKLEPVITPPVLPVLEHLERDPSTLLPNERRQPNTRSSGRINPKFGFGGSFNVAPSNGGLSASVSSSGNGLGASQSASQSYSFGFNQGFSASQSASQAASFNHHGFGSGFSGSQASSQAASFSGSGSSLSAASSNAAAFGGGFGGLSGSQSASNAFGFNQGYNSLNGVPPNDPVNFGDGLLDIRHRGVPNFPTGGRGRGVGAAAFRSGRPSGPRAAPRNDEDIIAIVISD